MKKTEFAILSLLLALGLLAGCASVARPAGKAEAAENRAPSLAGPPVKPGLQGSAWLTDREWTISGFNTGSQFVPLEPGHGGDAWLYFSADGSLSGFTGTNSFRGKWKLGAKNAKGAYPIVLSPGAMTKKAAINEIAARFEITFIADLQKSASLVPLKSGIELFNSAGERQLSFVFLGPPGGE